MDSRRKIHPPAVRWSRKFVLGLTLIAFALGGLRAPANPIGDFFKSVGRTLGKWHKPPPQQAPKKSAKNENARKDESASKKAEGNTAAPPTPAPSPTSTPMEVRPARPAPPTRQRRDVPYGLAVPNKPGFVTSPYAPQLGYVDVRAFPHSTEVLDPFTGKVFLTP